MISDERKVLHYKLASIIQHGIASDFVLFCVHGVYFTVVMQQRAGNCQNTRYFQEYKWSNR